MNNYDNNLTENMFKDFTDEPKPIIMDFENKNLFKPAEIKNFEEWNSKKKIPNYFMSTEMFEIYKGIRTILLNVSNDTNKIRNKQKIEETITNFNKVNKENYYQILIINIIINYFMSFSPALH
jgi:hypothetical protein